MLRLLERCFANPTPHTVKARMATATAERFAIIADWRQLGTTLRIAAAMSQIFSRELGGVAEISGG
jgi:hypothetical protein